MGKVNSLYQQERQDKFDRLVETFLTAGCTQEEAEEMAQEEIAEEDFNNGQFGAGA